MSDTGEMTGTEATESPVTESPVTESTIAESPATDVEDSGVEDSAAPATEVSDSAETDAPTLDKADDVADATGDDAADEKADDGEADDEPREDDASETSATSLQDRLENEGDIAADYLEELLDIADLDGDLDMDVEGERAIVSIVGADLAQLVGERGEVLEALQELTRLAVYRETGDRSRLMLDISGHRAEVRRRLEELAAVTAAQVKETGERVALKAMTPFERKVVHDAVAAAGLTSESEGVEPRRYVVVLPA
jgi:spoIIIJ-associated protein